MNLNPSEAQKAAGNYAKKHMRIHGLDVTIENPRGSMRRGSDADGNQWECKLPEHYGYIKRTEGADGDQVDCYVGQAPTSDKVFVVDQLNLDGEFDEHKCLLGFRNLKEAKDCYVKSFSDGKGEQRIGNIIQFTVPRFKEWLKKDDTTAPANDLIEKYARGGKVKGYAEGGVTGAFDDLIGNKINELNNSNDPIGQKIRETTPIHRSPEALAFLNSLAASESPDYNTIYGGQKFNNFADHPRMAVPITTGPNAGLNSTAAGRYQFLANTWDEQKKKLNLKDFSPENQDIAAWDLAATTYNRKTGRDLLKDLQTRDPRILQYVANTLSSVWTSLPGGIEPNKVTNGFSERYLKQFENQPDLPLNAKPIQALPNQFGLTIGAFDKPQNKPIEVKGAFDDLLKPQEKDAFDDLLKPQEKDASKKRPKVSVGEAIAQGTAQGLTFGFADEMIGGANAVLPEFANKQIKIANQIAQTFGLKDKNAIENLGLDADVGRLQRYKTAREEIVERYHDAEKERPYTTGAAEVLSGLVLPVGGQLKTGATLGAKTLNAMKTGAITGGLTGIGQGEGLEDRLARGAIGTGVGTVAGAVAPSLLAGLGLAGRTIADKLPNLRGLTEKGAEKKAQAIFDDAANSPKGPLSITQPVQKYLEKEGYPIAAIDTMGEKALAAARWAANVNPEARQLITDQVQERFKGQHERVAGWLNKLIPTPGNAAATREELQAALEKAQKPLYDKAMRFGANGIDHPEFARLQISEQFQKSMKTAEDKFLDLLASGRNHGDGITATGRFTLEYWDLVKKSLDDKISAAVRAGEKNEAANLTQMKNKLVNVLDEATTVNGQSLYANARGTHAAFRGADNAIEFGESLMTKPIQPGELRKLYSKMKPEERLLTAEGYISAMKDKLLNKARNRSVEEVIKDTPNFQKNLEILIGPLGAREFEARMLVERGMDRVRNALGNSTTARQLFEMGFIGGTPALGSVAAYANDPNAAGLAIASGLIGYGSRRANQRVAMLVAEKLMSKDPKIVQQGYNQLRNNKELLTNLRRADIALTRAFAINPPQLNWSIHARPNEQNQEQPTQ